MEVHRLNLSNCCIVGSQMARYCPRPGTSQAGPEGSGWGGGEVRRAGKNGVSTALLTTDLSHGFPLRQSWLHTHSGLPASPYIPQLPQLSWPFRSLMTFSKILSSLPTCYIYTSPLEFLKLQSRCLSTAMQQKQPVGQSSRMISSSTTVRENKVSGLLNGT